MIGVKRLSREKVVVSGLRPGHLADMLPSNAPSTGQQNNVFSQPPTLLLVPLQATICLIEEDQSTANIIMDP
jgi:hypothetical protein